MRITPKITYLLVLILFIKQGKAQEVDIDKTHSLRAKWNIDSEVSWKKELFELKTYKPVYMLFANYSTSMNQEPQSDAPYHSIVEPLGLDATELKFQLSFKTKMLKNIFGKKIGGSVWMAYTQSSRWQAYNQILSRPFRETNYEPEIMFIVPTRYSIFGINGAYAGIGLNHQSNGRANPLSRSWNRMIMQFGWEINDLNIVLNPWMRIHEPTETDDNPNIENYIGRGELILEYTKKKHKLYITGRHSLRSGDDNRGSIRANYSIKVHGNLKLFTQMFHGYGENMIDYNHKQTTFGIGVAISD